MLNTITQIRFWNIIYGQRITVMWLDLANNRQFKGKLICDTPITVMFSNCMWIRNCYDLNSQSRAILGNVVVVFCKSLIFIIDRLECRKTHTYGMIHTYLRQNYCNEWYSSQVVSMIGLYWSRTTPDTESDVFLIVLRRLSIVLILWYDTRTTIQIPQVFFPQVCFMGNLNDTCLDVSQSI